MNELIRIADQALKMVQGEVWHGPSVREILADVDSAMAYAHPIAGCHSIWELIVHLIATQSILLRRIEGHSAGREAGEYWPSLPVPSESAWKETLQQLNQQEENLREVIKNHN